MDVHCKFEDYKFRYGEKFYNCLITSKEIPEDMERTINGHHQNEKTDNDVQMIFFDKCTITKVPQGLTKIFPNIKILFTRNSNLNKICKADLIEYKNLEKFLFDYNQLEYLPGDLFEDFKNLNHIKFYGNDLEIIEPNILDRHEKLNHVSFRNNPNYTKCFSIYPVYNPNATLQEVKNELYEKFFSRFKFLQDLKKSEENLAQQVQEFKDSEAKLLANWEIEKLKNSKLTLKFQTGFLRDLKSFTQDETTKDFRIQIGDREFPVHKFLLAARSPTLAEILRNNPEVENLKLVDISVEIFEKILKFLYTDELSCEDGTNFLHLFAAAGRLKVEELKNFAAKKITETIDEKSALEILILSNKYEHKELRQNAFDAIKKKYPQVKFKDELAVDMDQLNKFIEIVKRREEADKLMEEFFKN